MKRITRRDFLNGVALSAAGGLSMSPFELLADTKQRDYPPGLTGLRGSHVGSFEVAHKVARQQHRYKVPKEQTDQTYDLVIAGGGISGLAAAYLYRQRHGNNPSILVLDNHDDFGGHAKRNEFSVDGQQLIGYGGSQSIEAPSAYSKASAGLLQDIAIDTDRFYDYFDQGFSDSRDLSTGLYFSQKKYGKDRLARSIFGGYSSGPPKEGLEKAVASYPISVESRSALLRLMQNEEDYLRGKSPTEKIKLLQTTSYTEYLHRYTNTPREVTNIFREMSRGIWGVGWDALSALEAYRWGNAGTGSLGIETMMGDTGHEEEEPYIFHFPDGNAGVARSLVRKLIPQAIRGNTMEDLVLARVDYSQLDRASNATRVRLNATAVDLRHTADQKAVDVTYVSQGATARVRAKHVIYAGYHAMLPAICAELPPAQLESIAYATKVPLVYINIALRNWQAFENLGVDHIAIAQPELMHSFGLDFPVSMGGYHFAKKSDQPIVVHGTYVPAFPGSGMTSIEQHKAGRHKLYEMNFADFEDRILADMSGALGGGGFDAERDIAAITVNRWPHGYAYEYNELFDDPDFGPEKGPHLGARAQLGRISIANSDSSAYAYVDGAIDAADRAVNEQIKL
jgi:spermidine dehydrogenase